MKRLRDVYEELDGMTLPLDKSLAFQLLTKVDVRSAMSFAIASGGDPNYRNVMLHMRQDTIWKFWMERDLKIVNDVLRGELPEWVNVSSSQSPVWKTVYLWYRLVVSVYQHSVLSSYNYKTKKIIRIFAGTYSQYSHFKFVTLNEFELIRGIYKGDDGYRVKFDFRDKFSRMLVGNTNEYLLQKYGDGNAYNAKNVRFLFNYNEVEQKMMFDSFIMRYKKVVNLPECMDIWGAAKILLFGFFDIRSADNEITSKNMTNSRSRFNIDENTRDILSSPPRIIESTRIIVASCVACNQYAGFQCAHCNESFCSLQCQINTH